MKIKSFVSLLLLSLIIISCSGLHKDKKTNTILLIQKNRIPEDTFKYIQDSFINHKGIYLRKSVNNLLEDLKIPIKSYYFEVRHNDASHTAAINLSFFDSRERGKRTFSTHGRFIEIWILFEEPVPMEKAVAILRAPDGREWSEEVKAFYGNMKIKDFNVYKYNYPNVH